MKITNIVLLVIFIILIWPTDDNKDERVELPKNAEIVEIQPEYVKVEIKEIKLKGGANEMKNAIEGNTKSMADEILFPVFLMIVGIGVVFFVLQIFNNMMKP